MIETESPDCSYMREVSWMGFRWVSIDRPTKASVPSSRNTALTSMRRDSFDRLETFREDRSDCSFGNTRKRPSALHTAGRSERIDGLSRYEPMMGYPSTNYAIRLALVGLLADSATGRGGFGAGG